MLLHCDVEVEWKWNVVWKYKGHIESFSLMLQDREWNSVYLVKHFDTQKHLLEMCFFLPNGIDEVNIHKVLSLNISIRGNSCATLLWYDDVFSGICTYVDMWCIIGQMKWKFLQSFLYCNKSTLSLDFLVHFSRIGRMWWVQW